MKKLDICLFLFIFGVTVQNHLDPCFSKTGDPDRFAVFQLKDQVVAQRVAHILIGYDLIVIDQLTFILIYAVINDYIIIGKLEQDPARQKQQCKQSGRSDRSADIYETGIKHHSRTENNDQSEQDKRFGVDPVFDLTILRQIIGFQSFTFHLRNYNTVCDMIRKLWKKNSNINLLKRTHGQMRGSAN